MINLLLSVIVAQMVALIGVVTFLTLRHEAERHDLYSRLMSRDLTDYAVNIDRTPLPKGRNTVKAGLVKSLRITGELEGGE